MAYLYIKSNKIDALSMLVNKKSDEIVIKEKNSILVYDSKTNFHQNDNNNLVFDGRILVDKCNSIESYNKFIFDNLELNIPLDNSYSGTYSGFIFNNVKTFIFNDVIGINNLFYYMDNETIIISDNLTKIHNITKSKINNAGIILETCNHFSQFAKMTVLENVFRLLPGELLIIEDYKIINKLYDTSIKKCDESPTNNFSYELVELINNENKKMYSDETIVISLSGGIDSRINLAPLISNNQNFSAINYGIEKAIDSKIPINISKKFNFDIEIIDPTPCCFLEKELNDDIIDKTNSLFINSWHSIILKENKKNKLFLLGDMIDILRAKSISTLKTRAFRTKFYIKKFLFNSKLQLNVINENNYNEFKINKLNSILKNVKNNFKYFHFTEAQKENIIINVTNDVEEYFQHLKIYNFKYIESFEEFFVIFTSGRLAMGKQLNIIKYKYRCEIPLLNIKILRKVLNIAPNYRYADELTTKMFKHKSWFKLGKFPTSQNPMVSYNSSFYLMMFGWFLRSKTDFFLTKLFVITNGKSKYSRLYNSFDHQATYTYKNAYENYKSYFKNDVNCNFEEKINLFEERKNKKSWPLASMDLMPFVQVSYYLKKFK